MPPELPVWFNSDDIACRDVELNTMYPDERSPEQVAVAKSVCDTCFAQQVCLEWALDKREYIGVYGGRTGSERHNIVRKIAREKKRGQVPSNTSTLPSPPPEL